ncbi:MAG: hypothetical protein ACOVRM_14465, partial [Planctomycetaceae bacterium]
MFRVGFRRVWRLLCSVLLISLGAATGEFLTGVEAGRPAAEADEKAAESSIRAVLTAQTEAWNRGDIPGFMQGYVRGEALRFASGAFDEAPAASSACGVSDTGSGGFVECTDGKSHGFD